MDDNFIAIATSTTAYTIETAKSSSHNDKKPPVNHKFDCDEPNDKFETVK